MIDAALWRRVHHICHRKSVRAASARGGYADPEALCVHATFTSGNFCHSPHLATSLNPMRHLSLLDQVSGMFDPDEPSPRGTTCSLLGTGCRRALLQNHKLAETPSSGYVFGICHATKDGRPGLKIPNLNVACASQRLSANVTRTGDTVAAPNTFLLVAHKEI